MIQKLNYTPQLEENLKYTNSQPEQGINAQELSDLVNPDIVAGTEPKSDVKNIKWYNHPVTWGLFSGIFYSSSAYYFSRFLNNSNSLTALLSVVHAFAGTAFLACAFVLYHKYNQK